MVERLLRNLPTTQDTTLTSSGACAITHFAEGAVVTIVTRVTSPPKIRNPTAYGCKSTRLGLLLSHFVRVRPRFRLAYWQAMGDFAHLVHHPYGWSAVECPKL